MHHIPSIINPCIQDLFTRFNDFQKPALAGAKKPLPIRPHDFFFIREVPADQRPSTHSFSKRCELPATEDQEKQAIAAEKQTWQYIDSCCNTYRKLFEYMDHLLEFSQFDSQLGAIKSLKALADKIASDCHSNQSLDPELIYRILRKLLNREEKTEDFSSLYLTLQDLVAALEQDLFRNLFSELQQTLPIFLRAAIVEEKKPLQHRKLSKVCKRISPDVNGKAFSASLLHYFDIPEDAETLLKEKLLFERVASLLYIINVVKDSKEPLAPQST
ncbi:MAG: hypothetical protein K0S07_983 [Chlamydiales bacterium]|jgi:hypothetical protein|nr:hypothetical protein [Chlamydiales bacterium]